MINNTDGKSGGLLGSWAGIESLCRQNYIKAKAYCFCDLESWGMCGTKL